MISVFQKTFFTQGLIGLLAGVFLFMGVAVAAPAETPLEITANQMDLYPDQKKVVFSGNVIAIQGTSKITCATLTAFYTSDSQGGLPGLQKKDKKDAPTPSTKGGGAAGALDKIIAAGNVNIFFDDMTAKADRAEFNPKTDILTLYGEGKNVEVRNEDGIIRGKTIVANRATGETVVKSSPTQRVQAVVFSTGEISGKAQKDDAAGKK